MRRFLQALRLLLPSRRRVLAYWVLATGAALAVAFGLERHGARAGTLWGLPLRFPGATSEAVLRNAYVEMLEHVWTLCTLPTACFLALRPLLRSLQPDFRRFLRFSHGIGAFVESVRILAVLGVVGLLLVPFLVAVLVGVLGDGFDGTALRKELATLCVCTSFVCTLVFGLAALGLPADVSMATGLVVPFLATGIAAFLERSDFEGLFAALPPGLPYSVETPHVRTGAVLVALLLTGRWAWVARRSIRSSRAASPAVEVASAPADRP